MEVLRKKIAQYDNIFIYGCGVYGKALYRKMRTYRDVGFIRFCDKNAESISYPETEVLTPAEAFSRYPDALFCIGTIIEESISEMISCLIELGVPEANIVKKIPQEVVIEQKCTPRTSLGNIEYHITEHCNLNCAGCLHFFNIAEEEYADLQTFNNDMARLAEILNGDISSVVLLGGEPLLHPQVVEFIKDTRKLLPKTRIFLDTNGILLPKMSEEFWQTLQRNAVIIKITKYPININMESINEKSKEYGVRIIVDEFPSNNWDKYVYNTDGKLDAMENFLLCPRSNFGCVRLYKGRLYPCTAVGNAEHFNKKFGLRLPHLPEDSINIYSNVSAQDIFNFLSKPVPFCRFCDMKNRKVHQDWKLSKKEISEFI